MSEAIQPEQPLYPGGKSPRCRSHRRIDRKADESGRCSAQAIAAHESPRTTKLYNRTGDEITLDEVERIAI